MSCLSTASASEDLCEPTWALDFARKVDCANLSVLTPSNDTRANLLLLLSDRYGDAPVPPGPVSLPVLSWSDFRDRFSGKAAAAASAAAGAPEPNDAAGRDDYPEGEGSRCRSNRSGTAAFKFAVAAASGLSADERTTLIAAREALRPACEKDKPANASASPASPVGGPPAVPNAPIVSSAEGRAFATYLRGVDAFYRGRYDDADTAFEALKADPDPWLSDASAYMLARAAVNRLQVGAFDSYGVFKDGFKADPDAARRATASLDAYLEDHPRGRFAKSARGLLRRVDWLADRTESLAARYAALLETPPPGRDLSDADLADEIDGKLLPKLTPAMTRNPMLLTMLLTMLDLERMRKGTHGGTPAAPIDLAAQRDAFASEPALYGFLTAASAFFVDGATAPVLEGAPDDTRRRGGDHLWFSRQVLRGEALEAAGDRNAEGFWRELFPGAARPLDGATVALALALDEERRGKVAAVFAPGSPVTDPAMRQILLEHAADAALLRGQSRAAESSQHAREVALFILLYKELVRGGYEAFLDDLKAVPTGAAMPGDPNAGGSLPQPTDTSSAVVLGVFPHGETEGDIGCPALPATVARLSRDPEAIRDRLCLAEFLRLNGFDEDPLDIVPPKGELGSASPGFPEKRLTREAIYIGVIADRRAPAADRAYALYRAVKCYEPLGEDGCGGPGVPKATRKAWHDALKRDYPASRWAKDLDYWW